MGNVILLMTTNAVDMNVVEIIGNLGFPIFVAVWLLWKSHKDTEVIKDSVDKLENSIVELITYIKALKGDK